MPIATRKPLYEQSAADLLSRVVPLPETMPLREAAQGLLRAGVHGAPVVDADGRCVGVLSVTDLARWAVRRTGGTAAHPRTCPYQEVRRGAHGDDMVVCTLPTGTCPYQDEKPTAAGPPVVTCREPHALGLVWQMVDMDALPAEEVRQYMSLNPVTASPDTPIADLARMMVNDRIHRVVVLDPDRRPIGLVSVTDLMAALAAGEQT